MFSPSLVRVGPPRRRLPFPSESRRRVPFVEESTESFYSKYRGYTCPRLYRKGASVGLADEFERRLERVVEGFFSKAFRSKIEPAEIGRRLMREMEGGKTVSVAAVYVPNRFGVRLSPVDHERLEGLLPTLESEFVRMLKANARERAWRPAGALKISFETSEELPEGRFEVLAEHDSSAAEASAHSLQRPVLLIGDADPPRRFSVGKDRMLIGRLEECDLVLVDAEVSRRHAEITRKEDAWWITDLQSANGTFVNNTHTKERRLLSGDRIKVGNTEIEFLQSDPEEAR